MAHAFSSNGNLTDPYQTDIDTDVSDTSVADELAPPAHGPSPELHPTLSHQVKNQTSVLALAVSGSHIYAGTQGGQLAIWSSDTYELITSIFAHDGSVLCLKLSVDGELLFSSAGDAIVNVWCTAQLARLYSVYSTHDVGDVFCVAYSESLQTMYLGAQNTSIQVGRSGHAVPRSLAFIACSGTV